MVDVNVLSSEWDIEMPELGWRAMRLRPKLGSAEFGASVYELDPGGAVSPIHAHHGNEELLLVLSGRANLRTPDGARDLEPGAIAAFPRGVRGAHQIANTGEEPARVLIVSTVHLPDVTELVTTGTIVIRTSDDVRATFPAGSAQDFTKLWRAAFEADRPYDPDRP